MDIEFHYYMTYLIAARAGFAAKDARCIAYSSQYVDDNDVMYEISKGTATAYRNYISQTMNILKPKDKLIRIYPLFHFIPGDPGAESAWRKDGKMHWMNTTPNSKNANAIIDSALESRDLFRIGIAAHSYVDTWAHQNFIGYFDDFNAMEKPKTAVLPNVGHAEAEHDPDEPALIWRDPRLIKDRVDNRARFLDAARHLYAKLARFCDPAIAQNDLDVTAMSLCDDLDSAIGDNDQTNALKDERAARYLALAQTESYGDTALPEFDPDTWFDDAVNEQVRGVKDRSGQFARRLDPFRDVYTWKSDSDYQGTDWHQFQQAVKAHQAAALAVLAETNLKGLSLEDW